MERRCSTADIDSVRVQTGSARYYEVSAKDGTNIQEMFTEIGKDLYLISKKEQEEILPQQ